MNDTTRNLQGVLLDLDGTLIDSNDANARAWADALGDFGYSVPLEKLRRMVGMGADNLLPQAVGITKDSDIGQGIDRQRAILLKEKYLAHVHALPKARELLERIHAEGLKLILASSAKAGEAEPLIDLLGPHAAELFDVLTTSDDAKRSKPSPDIVQAALGKAGLAGDECIMLGDTPYDMTAAEAAGVEMIAFRCGGWPDGDLEGAAAIYDDPADLLDHYDGSLLARRESELCHKAGEEIAARK